MGCSHSSYAYSSPKGAHPHKSKGSKRAQAAKANEVQQRNAAVSPLLSLPPDCLALIYSKLDRPKDRRSLYDSCKGVRVPAIQCLLNRTRLFKGAHYNSFFKSNAWMQPLRHHPVTQLEVLEWDMRAWADICSCSDQRPREWRLLRELQRSRKSSKRLKTVSHLHLVGLQCTASPPWSVIKEVCPRLTTISGLVIKASHVGDLEWLHKVVEKAPTLQRVQLRVAMLDGIPAGPWRVPPVHMEVQKVMLWHVSLCQHYSDPGFAHAVQSVAFTARAFKNVRDADAGMGALAATFPNVKVMELDVLRHVGTTCNLKYLPPLSTLRVAARRWRLREFVVKCTDPEFFADQGVADWLVDACRVFMDSTLLRVTVRLTSWRFRLRGAQFDTLAERCADVVNGPNSRHGCCTVNLEIV